MDQQTLKVRILVYVKTLCLLHPPCNVKLFLKILSLGQ